MVAQRRAPPFSDNGDTAREARDESVHVSATGAERQVG